MKKKGSFLALILICVMAFSGLLVACGKDDEGTDELPVVVEIQYSANLNIVVVDSYNQPLADATVTLGEFEDNKSTTNANGVATFEKVPVGEYMFTVEKSGYAAACGAASVEYGLADNTVVPEIATQVAVLNQTGASISGRAIFTANDSTALADGAQMTLELSNYSLVNRIYTATTDSNGTYTFSGLPENSNFSIYPQSMTKNGIAYSAAPVSGQTGKAWDLDKKITSDISYTAKEGQFTVTTFNSFKLASHTDGIVINFSMEVNTNALAQSDITVSANPSISNLLVNKVWSNNNKTLTITPVSGTWGEKTVSLSVALNRANIKSDIGIRLGSGTTYLTAYLPEIAVESPATPSGLALTEDSNKNIEDGSGTILKIQWNKVEGATYAIYCRNIKNPGYNLITGNYNPYNNDAEYNIASNFNAADFADNQSFEVLVYAIVNGVQSITPAKLTIAPASVFKFNHLKGDLGYTITEYLGASEIVNIPSTYEGEPVTIIGNNIFNGKTNLRRVNISQGITNIGSTAFRDCTNLENVNFPESLTSIGSNAFAGCTSLENISIPGSLASINPSAFYGCTNLQSVFISGNVTSIGSGAFYDCTSLENINILGSITSIGDYVFTNTKVISNAADNSVVYLSNWVIGYKGNLTDVTLNNGTKGIVDRAFASCNSLESIEIPDSVTSIGAYAFSGCNNLENITIPSSVTSIGAYAFDGTKIIKDAAFDSVVYLDNWVIGYKGNIVNVTLNNGTKGIVDGAFSGCSSLESIVIPNSVTSIGDSVFRSCSSLESIVIPNSVTSIGESAFDSCTSLVSVVIPSSVTSINTYAFFGCTSLVSIIIPSSVTSIGNSAFRGCSNLTINAQAASKPDGWTDYWNDDSRPVNWGYTA